MRCSAYEGCQSRREHSEFFSFGFVGRGPAQGATATGGGRASGAIPLATKAFLFSLWLASRVLLFPALFSFPGFSFALLFRPQGAASSFVPGGVPGSPAPIRAFAQVAKPMMSCL